MNRAFYGQHKGAITIAEESTSWPGVSLPAHEDGLGFGFKWNMGFVSDTLAYMKTDPVHRRHHHDKMTFGIVYAFSENFVLPVSHDEVVHGKGSMLTKMPGDDFQQFANLRAYYGLMWGYPGKKLLFMGQEFAQRREWSEDRALDWSLRGAPAHEGIRTLVRDLNRLYREKPALHARDCEGEGFRWLIADDIDNSVFAWLRLAPGANPIAVVCNMTPVPRARYRVTAPYDGTWREVMNSDAAIYGGSGQGDLGSVAASGGAMTLMLPPLATIMLEYLPLTSSATRSLRGGEV
jgi:1,4-alpha-glucan branching enzyme